jgi:hypothetical protein
MHAVYNERGRQTEGGGGDNSIAVGPSETYTLIGGKGVVRLNVAVFEYYTTTTTTTTVQQLFRAKRSRYEEVSSVERHLVSCAVSI